MRALPPRRFSPLPGFGLGLGVSVGYLSLLVLLPLVALVLRSIGPGFWAAISDARVLAALRLSVLTALAASLVDVLLGLLIAWTLVRYPFPGRRLADALIDLPFALPTAVAGITLTTLLAPNGWLGTPLSALGIRAVYTPLGIVLALIFIGLPFVVRSVQPVLESLGREPEEAAWSLGASPVQTFWTVLLPTLTPALLSGFTLALARTVGEYGSVVFISGNLPYKTEIAPLLIVSKLQQFDYAGAAAIAVAMLFLSALLLWGANTLQQRLAARGRADR